MRDNRIFIVIVFSVSVFLVFFASSCGYKVEGGCRLPGQIKTISVSLFKNKSSQTGAEIIFTNSLIQELMRSSSVKIIDLDSSDDQSKKDSHNGKTSAYKDKNQLNQSKTDAADALIQGTIVSITFDALARTSDDVVYRRGVNAVVNIEMKSKIGDVLFLVTNFTETDSYSVTHDNSIDETIIKSTVEKVASRLARRVVSQMTDDF